LPAGADGVVPVEEVQLDGDMIRIAGPVPVTRYIARAGSDQRRGGMALAGGTALRAAQLAAAATVGAADVDVFARPRIGVLATGDELVPAGRVPAPHQIRDANSPMLIALLRQLECEPVDLGHVADKPDLIRPALEQGLRQDALLVSGGMSMGRHDYIPGLLQELGVELKISRLRIKPGKPFVYGTHGACHIFGLPGNPVSALVCAVRLVQPILRRMAGGDPEPHWILATLSADLPANGPREFYQPVAIDHSPEGVLAQPLEWKGSGDVFTLAAAHGLLLRPGNEPPRPAGSMVRILSLP
jgi:molybdopterin molybdotransferase